MADLDSTIEQNAQGPKRVMTDAASVTVEQHSLTEQIAADKYLASRSAASSPNRGLRFSKLSPPGAA